MEDVLARFGRIHASIHGDGLQIITQVLNTCEEMLKDRAYSQVTKVSNILETMKICRPVIMGRDGVQDDVDVYLHNEDRIGVKFIRGLPTDRSILIVSIEGTTPFTRKECEDRKVQFMFARELCYNITKHQLVPKFEVVSTPPNGVELSQLPKMLCADPVVQYFNWPIDTIVRVWRCFGGHEPIPYYRRVAVAMN